MLLILDPSLQSFNGHFLTYDKAIADQSEKFGQHCIVLGAQAVETKVMSSLHVVPCFRYGLEDNLSQQVLKQAFLDDLLRTTNEMEIEPQSVIFLHTTTHSQIEPAVRALGAPNLQGCVLIIMLRYSIAPNPNYPNAETVDQYRGALAAIRTLGRADRVRLVTDSHLLSDEYRTVTDLPIEILPIPHVEPASVKDHVRSIPRLVYLGNARSTKGFQYLPYLVSQIRDSLIAGEWIAEFQANVLFRRDMESVTALCALREEPVTLWEDELSMEQYAALLDRAGLVVLPYQTLYYHSQSSGVFAEAIGRGKPVVVPRGTWMASQLADSGAVTLFAPGDRVDFAEAVKKAMQNLDRLTACAEKAMPGWVAKHNVTTFVERLLQQGSKP
jgi:glycosyltransferase involved in cell wall biosynthesis